MMEANKVLQAEEVAALAAIYGADWSVVSAPARVYAVQVRVWSLLVVLTVTMPGDYPTLSPPGYELSAPWMERRVKVRLHHSLDGVYLQNVGHPVIFNWVEKIRSFLQALKPARRDPEGARSVPAKAPVRCPAITHGEVTTDRKSSFQGHAAQVSNMEEVHAVLASLKANKKIQNAKHNIFAFRIERSPGDSTSVVQDYDDDGEAHAGGRMLHVLEKMDQRNTLVVVTRWYGGIHLGPDRFCHITNATRQAIEAAGLLRAGGGGKNNKRRK